ncbi:hypothetical protein GX441_05795 [bacterium]|nr:hypothetical protein [bacterium]
MRKYLVMTALFLIVGFSTPSFGASWTVEKVTDNTEPDVYPLVVSVSSGLMVAYAHQDPDYEVFFANNFSGSWTSARVTDNNRLDGVTDIAARYDEQVAHIAFQWNDVPDREISYCRGSSSTSWDITRITDDANDDVWASIALDKSGFVHIVFKKQIGGDQEIFYANNVSGSWISEQVTDNASDDNDPWMALDNSGNPSIVYKNGSHLHYTHKTAGIWTSPVSVAGSAGVDSYPFILLDRNNFAHVVFAKSDGSFNQIYYANNVTGTWQESKVTSTSYNNIYPTLFVDPHDKMHIAYVAGEAGDAEIFYATNAAGVWNSGRVTDNSANDMAQFGRFFTCDASGVGHIFFYNSSDGDQEIYHAKSNEALYVAVEEKPISPYSPSITVGPFSSINSPIQYSVPVLGSVSLKVYDASGSLVKTLANGLHNAGQYNICWNGTTDSGLRATSGVYFFRLETSGKIASAKAILK